MRGATFTLITILIPASLIAAALWVHNRVTGKLQEEKTTISQHAAFDYTSTLSYADSLRSAWQSSYQKAATETAKQATLKKAGAALQSLLVDSIFPKWYGTPYNFYGNSDTPRTGAIACGYFVSTSLRDAGLRLDKTSFAKTYSEYMIKALIKPQHIRRYSNTSWEEFVATLKAAGDKLYIVGLDNHTGYILCDGGRLWFIHAYVPHCRKQPAEEVPILYYSNYRITGCVSDDMEMTRKWLTGEAFRLPS